MIDIPVLWSFFVRKNFCGDALTMPRVKDQEVIFFNLGQILLARGECGKSAKKQKKNVRFHDRVFKGVCGVGVV